MVYTTAVCTFIYNPITFTTHSCFTVHIPSASSALPCVSFTLSLVSVCFFNIHITRPCDLRRHAHCAARSPSITGQHRATRRRRRGRGSNWDRQPTVYIAALTHLALTEPCVRCLINIVLNSTQVKFIKHDSSRAELK